MNAANKKWTVLKRANTRFAPIYGEFYVGSLTGTATRFKRTRLFPPCEIAITRPKETCRWRTKRYRDVRDDWLTHGANQSLASWWSTTFS